MGVHVALLRGINVGPSKRMKMDVLRRVFADLGMEGAQTYLQSGNVVFRSPERNAAKLTRRIEDGIEQAFGFHSDVILRTTADLRRAVGANALADAALDPAKLAVVFLTVRLSPEETKSLQSLNAAPDVVRTGESEIYIYYPNGMGRSKLDVALGKVLKTKGTARNWRSVTNILAMMEKIEAGEAAI